MAEVETIPSEEHIGVRVAMSLVAVVVSGWVLINWSLIAASILRTSGRYDFSTYYAAAYALRHNLHANIYDAQVLAQAGAVGHTLVNPPLAYTYPPLLALVLSPFTFLPFKVLAGMWQVMNDVILLTVAVLLAREIAPDDRRALSLVR